MARKKRHSWEKSVGMMILLGTSLFVQGSCAPCDPDSIGQNDKNKPAMMRIVLGEGGGFAGKWEGYTIYGDGVVHAWSGKGARENEREVGRLDVDTMCVIWEAVKGLDEIPGVDSTGSLVRFFNVTVQDSTREYSWRPRMGVSVRKTAYEEIHARCIAAIQKSMKPVTPSTSPSGK